MSEHDLREGSKPRCPKCEGGNLDYKHYPVCDKVYCYRCGTWFEISSPDDFAQFFPIAAILEENQRLRNLSSRTYGELPLGIQQLLPDPHTWDNKNISQQRDWAIEALEKAEAENQRLAKELMQSSNRHLESLVLWEADKKRAEAAEAKLGKMRHELVKIEHLSKIEEQRKYASALDQIRLLAVAALAE